MNASDHDDGDAGAVLADGVQNILRSEDILPGTAPQSQNRAGRVVTMATDLQDAGREFVLIC